MPDPALRRSPSAYRSRSRMTLGPDERTARYRQLKLAGATPHEARRWRDIYDRAYLRRLSLLSNRWPALGPLSSAGTNSHPPV